MILMQYCYVQQLLKTGFPFSSFFILFPRCPSWAMKWNINLKHWSHVENYFPEFPLHRILFPSRSRSTGWNFGCSHCIHILHADYMLWFPTARAATRSLVRKPLSKASFLFESRKERWQSQVRLLECRVFGFLGSSKKQLLNETPMLVECSNPACVF